MDKTQNQFNQKEAVVEIKSNDNIKKYEEIDKIIKEGQNMFDFFGKSHMMLLAAMFAKSQSPWRFNEIRDETELSQTTLSTRLSDLVEEDLIVRRSYDEVPPRVEYEATQKLRDFGPVLHDMYLWWQEID